MTTQAIGLGMKLRRQVGLLITLITVATELDINPAVVSLVIPTIALSKNYQPLFRRLILICRFTRHFGGSAQRTRLPQAIDFAIPNLLKVVLTPPRRTP